MDNGIENRKSKIEFDNEDEMRIDYGSDEKTFTFKTIRLKIVKKWKLEGKRKQKTTIFEQTLNPFNLNLLGNVKTTEEIKDELMARSVQWELDNCKKEEKYELKRLFDTYF